MANSATFSHYLQPNLQESSQAYNTFKTVHYENGAVAGTGPYG